MSKAMKAMFQSEVPDIFLSLANIHKLIDDCGVGRNLSHLVMLRAS